MGRGAWFGMAIAFTCALSQLDNAATCHRRKATWMSTHTTTKRRSITRGLMIMLAFAVGMFGFGFALSATL